jgi:chorismate-pyruvate lyase
MINGKIFFMLCVGLFYNCSRTFAEELPQWQGDFISRVEILALLQTLNGQLLSNRSATAVLEEWCADHHMAPVSKITARLINEQDKTLSEDTRKRLRLKFSDRVKYRHVQLSCGSHVLSEADNWYVPSRLTDQMNRELNSSDRPFGKIIAPLNPYRRTMEVKIYWSPLARGWENNLSRTTSVGRDEKAIAIPKYLFMHRALVSSEAGLPISEVVETYTNETINFDKKVINQ